jgi:hypothetical protein
MMLRPGTQYIGATASNNAAKLVPFVYSSTDTALIEFTDSVMRVWVDDALVTRASVTATITNGTFDSDVTSWTDNDDAGISAWVTGGYLGLAGDGTSEAKRYQTVTLTDSGVLHSLDITIERGPVTLRVGSAVDTDDLINDTVLGTGAHSLTFTPTTDYTIEFASTTKYEVLVDSVAISSSGTMTLVSPYAAADLGKIRWNQSADVIYLAANGYQQYKIERRSNNSWSLVKYETTDGPFNNINTGPITITPSALSGGTAATPVTLTASDPLFRTTDVNSLIRLTSSGQTVTSSISVDNTFTNTIKVTGVTSQRIFTIIRSGTWSATVTLQRSLTSDAGPWEDVTTYTTNATITYDDTLDNQTAWYQIGVKTGDFDSDTIDGITLSGSNPVSINMNTHPFATGEQVSFAGVGGTTELNGNTYTITVTDANNFTLDGTDSSAFTAWTSGGTGTSAGPVSLTLDYPIGSIDGIARIVTYTSTTVVNCVVLEDFGGTDATDDWYGADWSSRLGYPTAVSLVEGRLGWAGRDKVWLSVSDQYESFDDSVIGDSGTIRRTIGSGPVDDVNWMQSLQRLAFGTDSAEWNLKTSNFDEPLTPTNSIPKTFGTQGAASVMAVKMDNNAVFIQQGGTRVMQALFNQNVEYETSDLSLLFPEVGNSTITRLAIQRKPDTRIHCIRTDGLAGVLVHDPTENVTCWTMHETGDGVNAATSFADYSSTTPTFDDQLFEDVAVLPGGDGVSEDRVYYIVNRNVNGSTVRYLEKWSLESECQGGTINKNADAHVIGTISGGAMSGLDHLEGMEVVAWVNGKDAGTATVSSGSITGLSESGSNACVGLAYTARFRSTKLGELTEEKNVTRMGVIMHNTHYQGLKYGPDFDNLDDLPLIERGTLQADDTVHTHYDQESMAFDGRWDTDSRVCIQAASPRPCTLLAAIITTEG